LGKTPELVEFRHTKRERCGIGSDTVSTVLAASSQSQTATTPWDIEGSAAGKRCASTRPIGVKAGFDHITGVENDGFKSLNLLGSWLQALKP